MSSNTIAARFAPMGDVRSPKLSMPLVLTFGIGALLVGIAGFAVSPKLGILALGLPIAPFFVLAPDKALLLVVAALPFDAVAALAPGSATLTKLLGMAALAGWVVHVLLRRQRIQIGLPGFFVLGWIAMAVLSMMWTPLLGPATEKLRATIQLVVFYFMVSNILKDESALKRAVDVWIGASAVVALLVLWQFHSGAPVPVEQTTLQRATLQVGNAKINQNALGAFLALPALAAVVIGRARQPLGWWRWLAGIPLGVAMILTGSRGAVVAFAMGIFALVVLRPRFGLRAIAAAFLIAGTLVLMAPQGYTDRLSTRFGRASEDRMSGRLDIWTVGMSMINDRPLLGIGYGGFQPAFYRYMMETRVDPRWASENVQGGRVAHNIYLTTVAEMGVPGGALLLGMLVTHWLASSRARRAGRGRRGELVQTMPIAVSVLLVGLAVFGMSIVLEDMKMTWFTLALANAMGLAAGSRVASRTPGRGSTATAAWIGKEQRS
jgi:O-antigen ligase